MTNKNPGDLIAEAEPYAHVLSYTEVDNRCSYCCLPCKSLKRCAACSVLKYCGVKCQKSDWSVHKLECKCYKQTQPIIPTDSVRLLLRIIIRHLKSEDEKLTPNDPGWRCFTELESHSIDIQRDEKRSAQFSQMLFTITDLTQDVLTLPPSHAIFSMFGKMVINTFSICDDDLQPIGSAVYTSLSMLDHDCDPNAVAIFTGTTVSLRAIKHIPDSSPNNIFISYIDQLKPGVERLSDLAEQYYFTCECSRCLDTNLDELMYSVKCQQTDCSGYLGMTTDDKFTICSECKEANENEDYISQSVSTMGTVDNVITDLEDIRKTKDFTSLLSQCEENLSKNDLLSENNIYKVRLLDLAFDSCINLQLWQKALEFGLQTLQPYRKLYPPNTPNLSLQLIKVGKMQLYLEKTDEAFKLLQEAEASLKLTHGTDHHLYKTLSELLCQCTEELKT